MDLGQEIVDYIKINEPEVGVVRSSSFTSGGSTYYTFLDENDTRYGEIQIHNIDGSDFKVFKKHIDRFTTYNFYYSWRNQQRNPNTEPKELQVDIDYDQLDAEGVVEYFGEMALEYFNFL